MASWLTRSSPHPAPCPGAVSATITSPGLWSWYLGTKRAPRRTPAEGDPSYGGRRRVRTGDFGDRATWPMPELRPADSSADCRGAGRPGRPVDVQSIRLLRPMPPQSGARAGYSRLCIPGRLPDGHAQPAHTYAYNCMSSHLITCGRRRARRRWWCGHWNSLPCMISREGVTFFFFLNDGHCHQQNRNVFSRLQALPNSNPFEGSSTFSLYGRFLESI